MYESKSEDHHVIEINEIKERINAILFPYKGSITTVIRAELKKQALAHYENLMAQDISHVQAMKSVLSELRRKLKQAPLNRQEVAQVPLTAITIDPVHPNPMELKEYSNFFGLFIAYLKGHLEDFRRCDFAINEINLHQFEATWTRFCNDLRISFEQRIQHTKDPTLLDLACDTFVESFMTYCRNGTEQQCRDWIFSKAKSFNPKKSRELPKAPTYCDTVQAYLKSILVMVSGAAASGLCFFLYFKLQAVQNDVKAQYSLLALGIAFGSIPASGLALNLLSILNRRGCVFQHQGPTLGPGECDFLPKGLTCRRGTST